MKAVTLHKTVTFEESRPAPTPEAGECLIRVHMAGICGTDLQLIKGYLGFDGVLGHEMVGTVIEGPGNWKGKRVVAEINCVCRQCEMCLGGLAYHCRNRTVMGIMRRDGCFAELIALPQTNLHEVPDSITDEEAVFIEPLAAAYQVLAQCPIGPRMNVSVVGPGRLGLLVAQVLANTGCKLTVIGRSQHKLLYCEKRGIQGIHLDDLAPKQDRDLVVDCTGSPAGLKIALELARPRGTVILKSTCHDNHELDLSAIVVNELKIIGSRCGPFGEAINALSRRAIDVRSMITRVLPLKDAVKAIDLSSKPETMKILLKMNKR